MIIVFSGTDGAGKTTQIERLVKYFEAKGKSCEYVWARGGYTPLFSSLKKIARKVLGKKVPAQGNSKDRERLLKKNYISVIWLIVAIWDLIFFYSIYVRAMGRLGKVVICDRYLEDTALDFEHNFGTVFNSKSFLWKLLLWSAPEPDHSFLLWVPVVISRERSIAKNEPFPDSIETLEYRLDKYLDENCFPVNRYYRIECTTPIDEVSKEIISFIEKS